MEVLQEVYFGRKPIEPMAKLLSKIRENIKNKPYNVNINSSSDVIKFNRSIESFFGFNSFALYIGPDNSINAYALPVDCYLSPEEKKKILNSLITNPTGFKYKDAMGQVSLIINVNQGYIDADYINDDEIMATILHEIGHGFFEAVLDNECVFSMSRKISNALLSINGMAFDKVRNAKQVTEKVIEQEFSKLADTFRAFKTKIKNPLLRMKNRFVKESMENNMKKNRIAYTNEKFADTFAAMYGYGEACHSGDIKAMQNIYDNANVPKYGFLNKFLKVYSLYIDDLIAYALNIQDEHPAELARVKTTAEYLKREIAKEGLDPKMKQELIAELDKVNKLIDDFINYPKDEDSMQILRAYYTKLYEKFGGDRREKDTDNDALFAAIDTRYDNLSKKR